MTPNLDHEILQTIDRIGVLEAQLKLNRQELKSLKIERAERDYGLKIGSVVSWRKGRGVVCEIDTSWNRPWVVANPFKKDGSVGMARRYLYSDWTVEVDTAAEAVRQALGEG